MNTGAQLSKATPSPGFQAVLKASAIPGNNCTYTSDFWQANPQGWMTDNIVIGQYTFTKEEGLQILEGESKDLAIRLQK